MVVLTEAEWGASKAALDGVRSGQGRRSGDERRTVEAVVRRSRDGARWRAVPAELGPRWRAARLHRRRSRRGVAWRVGAPARRAARGRPPRLGRGVRGRRRRARPRQGGRRRGGAARHALGRSRGGFGTKACAAADGRGRALAFALLPGRAAELKAAPGSLARVARLGAPGRVVRDRAYSSDRWRGLVAAHGAAAVVPAHPTHRNAPPHDRAAYRRRHRVENLWARLEEHRAVATRYDETAASYLGTLHLATALDRLHNRP